MKLRRAWFDPCERPESMQWFQLYDARTDRFLGLFFHRRDVIRFVVRRPPTQRFRLVFLLDGLPAASCRCRSAFGGRVKGLGHMGGD